MVSAVMLLFAMVQPSLHVARALSKQSVCIDRLHGIMTASAIYSDQDPMGITIPVNAEIAEDAEYLGAYEWGGKSGIGRPNWIHADSPLGSKYGTLAGFGPAARPLNNILYPHGFRDNYNGHFDEAGALLDTQLDLPAYRCPADDGPPDGGHCPTWVQNPGRMSYDHFGTSYTANVFMIGSTGGGEMLSNSPYLRPYADVIDPARTIFYQENIGRWAWAAKTDPCGFIMGIDVGPTGVIRGWHGKPWTYNLAFGDGHAGMRKIYIEGTRHDEIFAHHYQIEQVFEDPGEQGFYACVIVRGEGWQKDTLPAEPIPTGQSVPGGTGRTAYEDCVAQ